MCGITSGRSTHRNIYISEKILVPTILVCKVYHFLGGASVFPKVIDLSRNLHKLNQKPCCPIAPEKT